MTDPSNLPPSPDEGDETTIRSRAANDDRYPLKNASGTLVMTLSIFSLFVSIWATRLIMEKRSPTIFEGIFVATFLLAIKERPVRVADAGVDVIQMWLRTRASGGDHNDGPRES